jgi:CelD/BcsL family acetyltransferase involved in cellulose biosynthesis
MQLPGRALIGTAADSTNADDVRGVGRACGPLQIQVFDSVSAAAAAWRDVQARASGMTPFQSFEWQQALVETFGLDRSGSIRIVVGRKRSRPVVIVPLMLSRRLGCRRLSWLGSFRTDYNGPLIDREVAESCTADERAALLAACFEAAGPADLLWLEKQLGDSMSPPAPGYRIARHFYRAHALTLEGTWELTRERLYSKNTMRRLREKERQLAKRGPVSFHRLETRAEISAAIRDLIGWKQAQLRSHGKASPFGARDQVFFVRLAADARIAEVFSLTAGNRTVAVCFALPGDGALYIYQMAYDAEAAAASPGHLLLNNVLELAVSDGRSVVDFTIGDEPYKLKICDRSRDVVRSWAPLTPVGMAAGHGLHLTDLARTFAAGHPTIRPIAQSLRRSLYKCTDAGRNWRTTGSSLFVRAGGTLDSAGQRR